MSSTSTRLTLPRIGVCPLTKHAFHFLRFNITHKPQISYCYMFNCTHYLERMLSNAETVSDFEAPTNRSRPFELLQASDSYAVHQRAQFDDSYKILLREFLCCGSYNCLFSINTLSGNVRTSRVLVFILQASFLCLGKGGTGIPGMRRNNICRCCCWYWCYFC